MASTGCTAIYSQRPNSIVIFGNQMAFLNHLDGLCRTGQNQAFQIVGGLAAAVWLRPSNWIN
jgi:hypothetical protein